MTNKVERINGNGTLIETYDYDEVFDDLFSSKVEAIRKAQQLFDRGKSDWVRVSKLVVAEKGVRIVNKKIYNKFRK